MIEQLTLSMVLGIIIAMLGFFIKKWIQTLEMKIDKMSDNLEKKIDKEELHECLENIQKTCERREKEFFRHYHTVEGKIVMDMG